MLFRLCYNEPGQKSVGQRKAVRAMENGKYGLFLKQKELLDTFLSHQTITQAQYDKSFGDLTVKMGFERAYFAGGCFWCLTPAFRNTEGVLSVSSGYAGGDEAFPVYADVKAQKTGHRETIEVIFDPAVTDYTELLDLYLHDIDPFDDGGQFIDRGFSYTTAVFYLSGEQKEKTSAALRALEERFSEKPAVAVLPYKNFYRAEEYHQDWDLKNPEAFEKELIESGRKQGPVS